jgi:hypothetical protein
VQLFGLEFTTDHARLAGSLVAGLLAASGFVAGRWSSHLQRSRLDRDEGGSASIVVEMASRPGLGEGEAEVLTASRTRRLDDFFQNHALAAAIRKAASKHPGLLRLRDPAAHRLMMVEAGNWLQGLNVQANLDFVAGRPTDSYEVLIGFAAYPAGKAGARLRDEADRLVLMVVNRVTAEDLQTMLLQEPEKAAARFPKRIFDLVAEWDRIRNSPEPDFSGEPVWPLKLRGAPEPRTRLPGVFRLPR